jgi:hypothetical protein
MSDYEFTMSLGIRHPHIDPAEITLNLAVAKRLSDANAHNAVLQGQVASLKKQLARNRPGARS